MSRHMQRSANKAKMHHYVPRSYLARFVDDHSFLHVFDRGTRSLRRQRPKEVMKINSYYRQDWAPERVDPNIMETKLGEWLEAEAKGAIDRLIGASATNGRRYSQPPYLRRAAAGSRPKTSCNGKGAHA